MRSSLFNSGKSVSLLRIGLVGALTLLSSGWSTCRAIVDFESCPGAVPPPQIISILPDTIPGNVESVLLKVAGSAFIPQSQILWNGNALPTTFADSHQLEATITQQTFVSFGGSEGSSVKISVRSPGFASAVGCPNGGDSATLVLLID